MPLSVICRNTWIVSFLFLNICKCYFFFLSEKVIFLCKHDVPKLNVTHCLSSLWMLQQRLFHPDIALICSDMEENRNKAVAVPELWKEVLWIQHWRDLSLKGFRAQGSWASVKSDWCSALVSIKTTRAFSFGLSEWICGHFIPTAYTFLAPESRIPSSFLLCQKLIRSLHHFLLPNCRINQFSLLVLKLTVKLFYWLLIGPEMCWA